MLTQEFRDLDELARRGRVFYETFPGTAASDVWSAAFAAAHHQHASDSSDPERKVSSRDLDESLDETFPASDSPANTVETGIRVGPIRAREADGARGTADVGRREGRNAYGASGRGRPDRTSDDISS